MGMVGTLIGLVQMLQTMDSPESIGPSMAVALLTTLYGAILAFLVFNPIADKLECRTNDEARQHVGGHHGRRQPAEGRKPQIHAGQARLVP